jgi:hypothetical protein
MQDGSSNGSLMVILAIVALAGAGAFAMNRRLATRRVEK